MSQQKSNDFHCKQNKTEKKIFMKIKKKKIVKKNKEKKNSCTKSCWVNEWEIRLEQMEILRSRIRKISNHFTDKNFTSKKNQIDI